MLEELYPEELKILKKLFDKDEIKIDEKLERLNTIYSKSEQYWEDYLDMIPNREVKYLLIAEAPPWSEGDDVTYVLNPKSKSRSILGPIKKVFLSEDEQSKGNREVLKLLANKHFLIIDTLPFSMNYTKPHYKRDRSNYKKLVRLSYTNYFLKKINNSGIKWSEELQVAFSLKNNAKEIIKKSKSKISFINNPASKKRKPQKIDISVNIHQIVANGAGNPDASIIKRVYVFKDQSKNQENPS